MIEHLLNPSADAAYHISRAFLTIAAVLMWVGWFLLWRSRNIDTGGRTLTLWWAFNSALFLTVYTTVRFYLGLASTLLPMWAAVCWVQAGMSIVGYIVAWNRMVKRRR